ncbi:MAG: hypothetical protein NVSMB1_11570 [Polyangiales bacterium]
MHRRSLSVCALAAFGSLEASGTGVDAIRDGRAFYAAIGARGGWELPIAPALSFASRLDVFAPLSRASLLLNGRVVWKAPPLNLAVGFGIVVKF